MNRKPDLFKLSVAEPVDRHGNPLQVGDPPEGLDDEDDGDNGWKSFRDRPSFEFAELLFEKMQTSLGDINYLLRIIQAKNNLGSGDPAIFADVDDLHSAIDGFDIEGAGWQTFRIRFVHSFFTPSSYLNNSSSSYAGPIDVNSPSWMREEYIIHTRDALALVKHMASNREFDGKWHTSPFEEFKENGERRWSDFMLGHWSWKEAVRSITLRSVGYLLTPSTGYHRS